MDVTVSNVQFSGAFLPAISSRHVTATIMKKTFPLVLIFIVGIVCGQFLPNFSFQSKGKSASSIEENKKKGKEGQNPDEALLKGPLSQLLYQKVLPETSPFWMLVNGGKLVESQQSFGKLFEEEHLSTISNDFLASFPQGVTQVIGEVIKDVSEARIFVLPGDKEGPFSLLFGFTQSDKTIKDGTAAIMRVIDDFTAAFPGTTTSETATGPQKVQLLQTPIGDYGYIFDAGVLWLTNQPELFGKLWGTPPPPPKDAKPSYSSEIIKNNPGAAIAFFMNAPQPGGNFAPPGFMPIFLASQNIKNLVALYQIDKGAGRLTFHAQSDAPPAWISNWPPLEKYPFSKSDPAGLVEVAFRWPGSPIVKAGTAAASINPATGNEPETVTPPQGLTGKEAEEFMKNAQQRRGNRRSGGQGSRENTPDRQRMEGVNPGVNPAMAQQFAQAKMPPSSEKINERLNMLFLEDMLPPESTVGVNVFGFKSGVPAMTFALPNLDPSKPFLKRVKEAKDTRTAKTEIAKIPGIMYSFPKDSPTAKAGLLQLLTLERDGVTYLFDEELTAKNYLGETVSDPEGKLRRDIVIREWVDRVKKPAQVQIILSKDFFQFILDQEKSLIPDSQALKPEMVKLADEISTFSEPMVLSAGYVQNEWFLEAYSSSNPSLVIDVALTGLAIRRYMGF